LKVTNENELVETKYFFDNAVITTHGWMPEKMEIEVESRSEVINDELSKDKRYPISLSSILVDLLTQDSKPMVKPSDLYQSVRVALMAEQNRL
jgi:hypothetical protein